MKIGIKLKINVQEIDKAQLYRGAKGTYLTVTSFVDLDEKDQWGNNGMVTQEISKELRDQGQKGAILGNTQVFWSDNAQQQPSGFQQFRQQPQQQGFTPQQPQQQPQAEQVPFDDDVPFAPLCKQYRQLHHCI
jgi:hypothetical protein